MKGAGASSKSTPRLPALDDDDAEESAPISRSGSSRAVSAGRPAPAQPKQLPVGLIVGGSLGTAVLAIGFAVAIVMMRPSGNGKPEAAKAPAVKPVEDETTVADATETPKPKAPSTSDSKAAPSAGVTSVSATGGKPTIPLTPGAGVGSTPATLANTTPGTTPASKDQPAAESPEETKERIKDATVYIEERNDDGGASGSGFVIQTNGDSVLVATNHHVVAAGESDDTDDEENAAAVAKGNLTVFFRSGRGQNVEQALPGKVIAWEREGNRDLAIVSVKGVKNPPKPIVLAADLKLTETMPVLVFGFPRGNIDKGLNSAVKGGPAITISKGSISALRRDEHGKISYVQFDSAMTHGNSGGPVVDEQGRLIGVAVAKLGGEIIGFAVPCNELIRMLGGKLGRLSVAFKGEQGSAANLQVLTRVIDPLKKVRDVSFLYGPAPAPGKGPKPLADGSWAAIEGGTAIRLTRRDQVAMGAAQVPLQGARKVQVQTAYLDEQGKTIYSLPIMYEVPDKPTEFVTIGLPPSRETPKLKPTFQLLGPLVNPSKQCKLFKDDKSVTLNIPAGVHLMSAEYEVKNSPMALADVDKDFFVTVHSVGDLIPGADPPRYKGKNFPMTFQGAGLIYYVDNNNYVRFEREAEASNKGLLANKLLIEACKNGKNVAQFNPSIPDEMIGYMAIIRTHNALQFMFGPDGRRWAVISRKLPVTYPARGKVGVCASNVSRESLGARFEDFVLITDPNKVRQIAP